MIQISMIDGTYYDSLYVKKEMFLTKSEKTLCSWAINQQRELVVCAWYCRCAEYH